MNWKTLPRRRFLRGAGSVAIALPFLEVLPPRAHAQARARRFVMFFTPEGTNAGQFFPTAGAGGPEDFTLGPLTAPLEPHKKDLVFFKGINHLSAKAAGSTHHSSMVHMLTGGGPDSIDQIIAREIGKTHRFPSLELSAKPRAVTEKGIMVYSGGRMIPGEYNPQRAFARMFTGGLVASPELLQSGTEGLFQRRKSVVDVVKGELDRLRVRLGTDDRARIEGHIAAIRDVERSLTSPAMLQGARCQKPMVDLVEGENIPKGGPLDKIVKAQMDLLVLALACDLTPVASLQISGSGSGETFPFLGTPPGDLLHGWVHGGGNPAYKAFLTKVWTWFAEQFAQLITRLKAIDEGGRSLFDSTALLWGSHFGNGGGHTPDNVPWVLAGSAGGTFNTGRFLPSSGVSQTRIFLAMAHGFGANVKSVGDPRYGDSPIEGVLS